MKNKLLRSEPSLYLSLSATPHGFVLDRKDPKRNFSLHFIFPPHAQTQALNAFDRLILHFKYSNKRPLREHLIDIVMGRPLKSRALRPQRGLVDRRRGKRQQPMDPIRRDKHRQSLIKARQVCAEKRANGTIALRKQTRGCSTRGTKP